MSDAAARPAVEMSGGDAIAQTLIGGGVDLMFGLPGVQMYGLWDAFERASADLRVICSRHEQGAAFMAFGYAKATGRVGVYAVVPGPGVLNSSAALSTAYAGSAPVLCLVGQIPSPFLDRGLGHLHELPDQLQTLRTLTKWSERMDTPAQAPALVARALAEAPHARPLPIALEMPWDVYDQREAVVPADVVAPPQPVPAAEDLERAAELLRGARNPMIMVGGGAFDAGPEILELADRLQAPVVSYRSGRGIVPSDHPLGFSCFEGFGRWAQTDVVIGIGTKLELVWYRWGTPPPGLQIIDVNLDAAHPEAAGAAVGLVGDSAPTTAALNALLSDVERPSRHDEFAAVKAATHEKVRAIEPHYSYLQAIRQVLPRDGFFLDELCQAGFASCYAFPVYQPRTFISFGASGHLGYGYPTALGVKAAFPDRAVVSISGDGGFQFGLAELATAMQYDLGVVAVVFNNNAYGNIVRDQTEMYGGRLIGAYLRNPDFVALAHSYGMHAERVGSPAALAHALAGALERNAPALIEVPVDPQTETSPWSGLMPYLQGTASF